MSNGHTPGPWMHSGRTVYALNDEGFNRFSALVQDAHTPARELEADARLIAAAPDLLAVAECEEALDMPHKQAVEVLERYGWSHAYRFELPAKEFVVRLRRAAIAKVKGQPC